MRRSHLKKLIFKEASPMNKYANAVKSTLLSLMGKMSASPEAFVKNPRKDFTRKRKFPFCIVIKLLISMGGNSLGKELLESTGYDVNTATTSAFIQQRDKIKPHAFEFLLQKFNQAFKNIKKYRGFRLLAVDGSDLHIPTNPNDAETYYNSNPKGGGHNLLKINAMYDLLNRFYVDAIVQPGRCQNESKALADIVKRSAMGNKVILIADRNYESYNNFATLEEKGWKYLIRVKDLDSNGILSRLNLPISGEFDMTVRRILTRKQTKEVKEQPDLYRFIPRHYTFDFLGQNNEYEISFRIVRFKIAEDSYQTIITNLDQADFSPENLKKLYHMRWGIETSFRELKYTVGLINFHSKKREHIVQEVFARIIMYNFAEMITSHVVISQGDTRYAYQVNFTLAIHICRHFLRLGNHAPPPDVEALIRRNILPVRPGRTDKRKIRFKTAVSFLYRVA
jgi:hypothetical protein